MKSFFLGIQKGLSLVEVMISLSIVAFAVITLTLAWAGNYGRLNKIKIYKDMAYLLDVQMKEFQMRYKGKKVNTIPKEEKGVFEEEFKRYSWKFESQELKFPDLNSLLIEQQEVGEMQIQMIQQFKDKITKTVREVRVSVSTKIKGKEYTQSVATYFVNSF